MVANLNNPSPIRLKELAVILGASLLFIGILSYANYNFSSNNPGGNDFTMRWLATRLLLTEGQSPYSEQTVQAVQKFMFGGPVEAGHDQALFTYPLYSALIFFPFALTSDYVLARTLWLTTMEVVLVIMAIASIRMVNWRLSIPLVLGTLLFVLLFYYNVRPLINGNISIIVGLFIVGALLAIRSGNDSIAGILLALSTVKPQVVVLLIPFILIWAVSQQRWRLITVTLVTTFILAVLSTLIVPDWLFKEIEQIRSYSSYAPVGTPAEIFSLWWPNYGNTIGIIFSILAIVVVIYAWKRSWRQEFRFILPAIFITLAATNFVGIATATSNYAALFPGLILAFAMYESYLGQRRKWLIVAFALILLVGLWVLFWTSLSGKGQPTIMYFPLPLFLIITFLFLRPDPLLE